MKNYDELADIISNNANKKIGLDGTMIFLKDPYVRYFMATSFTLLRVYLYDNLLRLGGCPCSSEGREDKHLLEVLIPGIQSAVRENLRANEIVKTLLGFIEEVKKRNLTAELLIFCKSL